IGVDRLNRAALAAVDRALAERRDSDPDGVPMRLAPTPPHYVTGEESALVHWINGGEAKPTRVPPRPFEKGVDGRPTLVDNVETLAHLAQILRFGSDWFRQRGTPAEPGTILATVSGAVARPGVYEVSAGFPLADLLAGAGTPDGVSAVLVGGYFGFWLDARAAASARLSHDDLRRRGGGLGCGAVAVLPGRCLRPHRDRPGDGLAGRRDRRPVRPLRPRPGRPGRDSRWRLQRSGPRRRRRPVAALGRPDRRPRRLPLPRRRGPLPAQRPRRLRRRPPPPRRRPALHRGHPDPIPHDSEHQGGTVAMTYRLVIDPIACTGHGVCADLLPERITLDDWGYPIIDAAPLDGDILHHARRTVAACPALALRLER